MYNVLNMIKFNRIHLLLLWVLIFFGINFQCVWWYLYSPNSNPTEKDRPSIWTVSWVEITEDPMWQWSEAMGKKSSWILYFPQAKNYDTELWYALALIQIVINRALWILAFIALVYMIYNWFLVLSSGSDSKNTDKGKKWIKNAVIAIAWIWISWLVISAMIWFINMIAQV